MDAATEDSLPSWGRVDCLLDVLSRLARLQSPRGQDFDINLVMQRSGIAQATFWRLITNRNERISLEVLARCCATLGIDITDLLVYRDSTATRVSVPIPCLVAEPIGDTFGKIDVVLPDVLDTYAQTYGVPLSDVPARIQLPNLRQRSEALIAGNPVQGQIDLPVLERIVTILTAAATTSSIEGRRFTTWLRAHGYLPGTVGVVLRYRPPDSGPR